MEIDLNSFLSDISKRMKKSAIREILKLTKRKGLISFAGGLPASDSFPTDDLNEVIQEVLEKDSAAALQYGTTEGDDLLRELLVKRYNKEGLNISLNNLVISTASQQALDILPKILINPGDKIICGLPSYLGGLSAFSNYGADMIGVEFDDYGMRADKLKEELESLKSRGEKPKFIYIIPDFQNPAGITMPNERRVEIIELAKKYDTLIVEDSPYKDLRYSGEHQKTFYQLDDSGRVITLGTFSKFLAPAFRIGWVIASEEIIDRFVMAKQSADLCTSPFNQKIVAKYIEKGYFEKNIKKIISMYSRKRDIMLDALEEFMPSEVSWTKPDGGLFLFVTLPEHINADELFKRALEENVAFVVGNVFFCNGKGTHTLRLNFSFASEEQNKEGIKRLANAIKKML